MWRRCCDLRAGEFRRYLFTGDARQKYAKRNGIGAGNLGNFSPIRRLRVARKICLTGPLEYKYCVIFVLVLGVICTIRSAVGQ